MLNSTRARGENFWADRPGAGELTGGALCIRIEADESEGAPGLARGKRIEMVKFHADCMACLAQGALKKAGAVRDEALKARYMRRVSALIAGADVERDSAPLVDARIITLRRELLGIEEDFSEVKHRFNALILSVYDRLRAQVAAAEDPILAAMQLAMAGNYIDFGVLKDVDAQELMRMLDAAAERKLDAREYEHFLRDLAAPGELVYIHDNCGEVALDKLLIETIRARFPEKRVASIVRGAPIMNDATIEDAREVGLGQVAEVLENGLRDVAGTELSLLPEDVRGRIEGAGMVLAKGQGNFETLIGCGLNVYYLLLSKCPSYTQWFGFEHFGGVLQNDRRLCF